MPLWSVKRWLPECWECACVCSVFRTWCMFCPGLPQWLSGKESACSAGASGDARSVSGSGRSAGGGHGNPLQYSFLENPTDRGAWWTTVHWVAKSQTRLKQLSMCVLSISKKQGWWNSHILPWSITVSVQFSSATQSCPTFCDPMDCSTPGLPVHCQLPECTQTHVNWVGDAIQPSHPLSSPSLPAFNLSQHRGLFQWVSSLHQVSKVLELQLQRQSFQWIFRTDFL